MRTVCIDIDGTSAFLFGDQNVVRGTDPVAGGVDVHVPAHDRHISALIALRGDV